MSTFNRVVLVILLLVAMVLCTTALVVPVWLFDALARQFAAIVDLLASLRPVVRLPLGILFAVVLDVILIFLLVFEVRRPVQKAIRVEKAGGGEVSVSVGSITDRLRYEVDQLSSVLRSEPHVSGKRGAVTVELDVETAAGINVPDKAAEIVETARRVVEDKMGLKLSRPPRVNLRSVAYPKVPQVPEAPRTRPPVPPAPSVRPQPRPAEESKLELPTFPEHPGPEEG
jgi:hypothetical protein